MAVEVHATPLANKIIKDLPRGSRAAYDQFEADLARRGCAALAYRLSGDVLEHLCVVHLAGAIRVIVAFESAEVAYVVLVGNHDDRGTRRWTSTAGCTRWLGASHRRRLAGQPPCCDTESGEPPVDAGLLGNPADPYAPVQGIRPPQHAESPAQFMTGVPFHHLDARE